MDIAIGLVVGVCLAASCGFRVFVPMLVMSVASKAGLLELSDGWSWLGSWPAIGAFLVATVAEICGYYIPWVDNLLDSISSPAAVVAGTVATAACVSELDPLLQWSAAIIAGGGMAATIKAATVVVRSASTAATAGLGNFLVATCELVMSLVLSILAVVIPVVAAAVLCVVVFFIGWRFLHTKSWCTES